MTSPSHQTVTDAAPEARRALGHEAPRGTTKPLANLLVITGLAGAGHSTALKLLEDIGYEAVDNLPLSLLAVLAAGAPDRPIAIGIDSRTRGFSPAALIDALDALRSGGRDVRLIFLLCSDEVLQRRFTETRRRHPLAIDRPVADGIRHEREILAPLREAADLVIDTSELSIGDLKRVLASRYAADRTQGLAIAVISFSYRQGLPREADLVLDARFLRNPHYEDSLRDLTGREPDVVRFIEADPGFAPFFADLTGLLLPLLPRFEQEGKSYLTVAIGCTGGKHRSVMVAERLAAWLRAQGQAVELRHRDVGRAAGVDA
jgi:UPF0042 nucleotide-binding protein